MSIRNFSVTIIVLTLIAVPAVAFTPTPEGTDRQIPTQWARSRSIDIQHLAIDLRFDWQKRQAYGTATISFTPFGATERITLDAGNLTINSITLGGRPLEFHYDGGDRNDGLSIELDRVYRAGEEAIVKIDYHTNAVNLPDPNSLGGSNGKGLRFNVPTSNDPVKVREIWSMGDPESNRYWFPGYDGPNDLRTTELTATVDRGLTVVSNGELVETKLNADGTQTFRYRTQRPYANHQTSIVVGDFVDLKQKYLDIGLHNFGYPHERDSVAATVERLPDMIKFFSELTGVKYPYANYSQVFVQDIGTFAGNNTVSTITENMVDDYPTHADFFYLWDLTEAEALASQWFGNCLSAWDWSEVWLNKSFAHYLNGRYNEHRNGRAEFLLWQHSFDQGVYQADWQAGIRHPIVTRNYESVEQFTGDNYATIRGSLVLNLLRTQLGEEKWQRAIKHYARTNANRSVTTADFQRSIEETTGESMDQFFDQWIYRMGHPVFTVTKSYDEARKQLTLTVKQTQTPDPASPYPQTKFFSGKVEIEIDQRIETVWLRPQVENIFTFPQLDPPQLVNFDFESSWIKEMSFERSPAELLYLFEHSRDILARNSAMIELVTYAQSDQATADLKAAIRTALRRTIASDSYWRLRNAALSQLLNLTGEGRFAPADLERLLAVIKSERSWMRANAIRILGTTKDQKYVDLYLSALADPSDRVISSAAVALGKTKSPKAFAALVKLVHKPSMKSQSLLSALSGLKELGDPRGVDVALQALSDPKLPRWRLPTPPVWDYRVVAADTIYALGKTDKAYPLVLERFKRSLAERDLDGVFNNLVLITTLADPRGQEAFALLKDRFTNDTNALVAVDQYEKQFKERLKRP